MHIHEWNSKPNIECQMTIVHVPWAAVTQSVAISNNLSPDSIITIKAATNTLPNTNT